MTTPDPDVVAREIANKVVRSCVHAASPTRYQYEQGLVRDGACADCLTAALVRYGATLLKRYGRHQDHSKLCRAWEVGQSCTCGFNAVTDEQPG